MKFFLTGDEKEGSEDEESSSDSEVSVGPSVGSTDKCGSPAVPGRNRTLHISTALPCSKHCNAKLLLRVGLIRAAKMHEYLISLCSTYEPRP